MPHYSSKSFSNAYGCCCGYPNVNVNAQKNSAKFKSFYHHRSLKTGVFSWRGQGSNRPAQKYIACKKFEFWLTNFSCEERTQPLKEITSLRAFVVAIYDVASYKTGHDKQNTPDISKN